MTYRCQKMRDAARDAPHCMGCGKYNEGDVVAAHSNQSRDGKGGAHKAADYRVAYLCWSCHSELDHGRRMSREERVAFWESAHRKTIGWLFESGKVVCR